MARKKIKVATKDYVSVNYVDTLKKLFPQVQEGNAIENPLVVPFILLCAAALEAKLNDEIVTWAYDSFKAGAYKPIAVAYLSMNLRGKLDSIVPILTRNKFLFRKDSKEYLALAKLITQRNSLVHDKSFYETVSVEVEGDIHGKTFEDVRFQFPDDHFKELMQMPFRSATARDCQAYYEALNALETKFLYLVERGALEENDLVARSR